MQKKKKLIMGMAVVLAVSTAVIGSTFAWFTANDHALNKMSTRKLTDGTVEIFEHFPDDKLEPGAELTKEVLVMNTGDVPVLVRVSFEEMLTKLGAPLAGTTTVPVAGRYATGSGYVPALVNPASYGAPYEPIDTLFSGVTGIPAGVTVVAYYDAAEDNYKIAAWKQITDAGEFNLKYQKVTVSFDADTEVVSGVNYWEAPLAAPLNYLWANTFDGANHVPPRIVGATTPFNNSNSANGLVAAAPRAVSGQSATAMTDLYDAANNASAGDYITLNFSTDLTTAMAATKWWYNTNDGWFYFIGAISSGGSTPTLLESVDMDISVLNSLPAKNGLYKYVDFDLDVKMQAIHALKAAIIASDGWKLVPETTTGANDNDQPLIAALEAFCS